MSFSVTKVDIWTSKIEDKPGGLAKVLGALGNAGGSLDCVIARRDPSKAGTGVVFLTPAKGAAVRKAAQSVDLAPAKNVATLKVEGDDAAGLGGRIADSNCRRGNKFARCFRRGDRQEVCGVFWFRQRCGRDKSGSRIERLGQSEEIRKSQALMAAPC